MGVTAQDDSTTTRRLLRCGMIVGPFYLVVALAQAVVREGFDLKRHALSALANGPGGWVQTLNFAISGLLVIAAALGIRRALAPHGRVAMAFLGAFGLSMIVAAVFPADPADGFPIGTPLGFPTSISPTGLGHFIAGAFGFLSLGVSALVTARALSKRDASSMARLSLFSGLGVLLGFFGGPMLPTSSAMIIGIWFAVLVGWAWLFALARHLR